MRFLSVQDNKTKQLAIKMKNVGSYLYKEKVAQAKKQCYETYGFVADPELTTRQNVEETLKKMPSSLYFNKPSNKQYHNLCTHKKPPEGIEELLGLGHKFVIQKRKSKPEIKKVLKTLRRDVRLKYLFAEKRQMTQST